MSNNNNKAVEKKNKQKKRTPTFTSTFGETKYSVAWSQEKLSHYKFQGRYLITKFRFLQISQHYIDRSNQQKMQICSQ